MAPRPMPGPPTEPKPPMPQRLDLPWPPPETRKPAWFSPSTCRKAVGGIHYVSETAIRRGKRAGRLGRADKRKVPNRLMELAEGHGKRHVKNERDT